MAIGQLNQRQQQILDRMGPEGEIKIADLKELFGVTEMTLRRDLEKLETLGHLRRTFGGAILVGRDTALQDRSDVMLEEKIKIGREAARLIQPGHAVYLDGGSTTLQIARHLTAGMKITVITNALNIATELLARQIPVIAAGGMVLEKTATMVGPIAAAAISGMAFDIAFMGTTGVTLKHGFSNSNMHEVEIKRLVIEQSAAVNAVLDHTKFGVRELFSFASLEAVDCIISDRPPGPELSGALKDASVEIMICGADQRA